MQVFCKCVFGCIFTQFGDLHGTVYLCSFRADDMIAVEV